MDTVLFLSLNFFHATKISEVQPRVVVSWFGTGATELSYPGASLDASLPTVNPDASALGGFSQPQMDKAVR